MRKLIEITIILLAFVFILPGCSNSNIFKDDGPDLELDTPQLDTSKRVTLNFYFQGTENDRMKDILEEIEKKTENSLNADINIKWIYNYFATYLNDIKTSQASGQPCDAFGYYSGEQTSLKAIDAEGLLYDITRMFPQFAPAYYSRFTKEELAAAIVGDKIVGIPNLTYNLNRRCAIVRQDLMKKYNLPEIRDYNDLVVYLKTIKEKEPGMIPLSAYDTTIGLFAEANGYVVLNYELGLVYKWDDPKMRLMAWEQTPEFKTSLSTMDEWYREGYFLKDLLFINPDESTVTSGKFASFIGTQGTGNNFNIQLALKGIKDWKYTEYPLYEGKPSQKFGPGNGMLLICKNSRNVDRVIAFAEWLHKSQENYDLFMYGLKGKDYNLDGETYVPIGDITKDSAYIRWSGRYIFEDFDLERPNPVYTQEDKKVMADNIRNKSEYPPHYGFVLNTEPLSEITTLRRMSFYEMEKNIQYEAFSLERVNEYIKEQKDSGVDAMVQNAQGQLDEWLNMKSGQ